MIDHADTTRGRRRRLAPRLTTTLLALLLVSLGGCDKFEGCSNLNLLITAKPVRNPAGKDFAGTWVRAEYISNLQQTFSPRTAQVGAPGITVVQIAPTYLKDDDVFVVTNHHDATHANVRFHKNKGKLFLYRTEAAGSVEHDAELSLYKYGKDLLLGFRDLRTKKEFKLQKIPSHLASFDQFLNRKLLTGTYTAVSDPNKVVPEGNISFLSDGEVIGHKSFRKFRIWYDFYDDVPQTDFIVFRGVRRGGTTWLAWSKTGAALTFYELTGTKNGAPNSTAKQGKEYLRLLPLDR